jgi:hypothetical protein
MIQRYDWKCECGHMQSVKSFGGPWCAAKTAIERISQLETALRAAIEEWENVHGPWRRACGSKHWIAISRELLCSSNDGGTEHGT